MHAQWCVDPYRRDVPHANASKAGSVSGGFQLVCRLGIVESEVAKAYMRSSRLWNFLLAFCTPFIVSAINFKYGFIFAGKNFAKHSIRKTRTIDPCSILPQHAISRAPYSSISSSTNRPISPSKTLIVYVVSLPSIASSHPYILPDVQ